MKPTDEAELGGSFRCGSPRILDETTGRPGDDSRLLSDTSLGGRQVIEASGSITATAVTIQSGSEITFRAVDGVILENGFWVDDQASLRIETAAR